MCPSLKPFDNTCVLTKAVLEVGETSTGTALFVTLFYFAVNFLHSLHSVCS